MGLLRTFFKREAKTSVLTYTPVTFPYQRPTAPATSDRALQLAFWRNELVYACINIKATAALDPALEVQRKVTKNGKTTYETIPDHAFRQLIAWPNEQMSEGDLMAAAIVSWDTSNPRRFYAEKLWSGNRLVGYNPLNPACMTPLLSRSPSHAEIGARYDDGYERKDYSFDDLIIRRAPAWYKPSPLAVAMGSVEMDLAQSDNIRAFYLNGGMPSHFLKYKSIALNDTQRETIRAKWKSIYGHGVGGQHGIGVLDMNTDIIKMGANLDELASESLRQMTESRICMPFGVPPLVVYAYVGLLRSTYSNLDDAWEWLWKATMSPAFKEWRAFWTRAGLSEFEDERAIRQGEYRLHYDMTQVAAMQENEDAVHDRTRKDYAGGVISRNEARVKIGYDPLDDDMMIEKPAVENDQRNGGGKRHGLQDPAIVYQSN